MNYIKTLPIFLLACLLSASCNKENTPADESPSINVQTETKPVPVQPPSVAEPAEPEESLDLSKGDHSMMVAASNALAMDLYRVNREGKENLLFSPASISVAFAMTYAGAKADTAEEMRKTLHFPEGEGIHDSAAHVIAGWKKANPSGALTIVNRLFGQKGYTFQPAFLERTKSSYLAPLETLDFIAAPEKQRKHINEWVAKNTEEKIKELLPGGSIKDDARLVLVNAIYFLGTWAHAFDKDDTAPLPFLTFGKTAKPVSTMQQQRAFAFANIDGVKLIDLPYTDSSLSMTLILPNDKKGLKKLEEKLTIANLDTWTNAMKKKKVSLRLPSFELKNARLPLKKSLQKLGMNIAFTRRADFSAMANPPNSDEELYIADAFHEAYIKVNEEGTEAAAATAAVMATKGVAAPPKRPATFHADHPFVFVIRDNQSGAILFLGRVTNPSK